MNSFCRFDSLYTFRNTSNDSSYLWAFELSSHLSFSESSPGDLNFLDGIFGPFSFYTSFKYSNFFIRMLNLPIFLKSLLVFSARL